MKNILILITVILLSGCSIFDTKEELTTFKEKEVYVPVPVPQLPSKINTYEFKILTVSPNNEESLNQLQELLNQGLALYVLTSKGYENLSLTTNEMERFIKEQDAVIKYYIKATKPESKDENNNANNNNGDNADSNEQR